jgi:toxin ParE1/3/4
VNTPRLTPQADHDIDEHAAYLSEQDPKIARRFLEALQRDCVTLCLHPELGNERYRDILSDEAPVRFIPVGDGFSSWLIFYLSSDEGILVIRVVHGSRDIPALFGDEKSSGSDSN